MGKKDKLLDTLKAWHSFSDKIINAFMALAGFVFTSAGGVNTFAILADIIRHYCYGALWLWLYFYTKENQKTSKRFRGYEMMIFIACFTALFFCFVMGYSLYIANQA